jgi:hypothetical protein
LFKTFIASINNFRARQEEDEKEAEAEAGGSFQ